MWVVRRRADRDASKERVRLKTIVASRAKARREGGRERGRWGSGWALRAARE